MFSKFVGLLKLFGGRITVGVDKNGNSYFRKPQKGDGVAEKRWVEFKGTPDPNTIPVEWTSWLSGTRKEAPSVQEILNFESQRKNVKVQAALLHKEEEKQRFRARVSRQGPQADEGSPEDMEVIMQQIGSGGTAKGEDPSFARYTKVRDVKESAEPTTWQPPNKNSRTSTSGRNMSEESSEAGPGQPKGQGDDFRPGTWKP